MPAFVQSQCHVPAPRKLKCQVPRTQQLVLRPQLLYKLKPL